ncbi:ribbon-helix-helix domain-containing protein [Bradyrhizobium roseum]|uniref:ribbon-helix-helix domain-containing protein n=1 Tax=Bradyrhizobium roseum TaxID=3056648 RepID=UPI00260F6938|nr:ribbon-helix-helix domain-containing protein [Bradyrhizobium roseus]WKA29334.1 ribbon-helix-helix domain-containing protein [Bradyrhizobium roseus]
MKNQGHAYTPVIAIRLPQKTIDALDTAKNRLGVTGRSKVIRAAIARYLADIDTGPAA